MKATLPVHGLDGAAFGAVIRTVPPAPRRRPDRPVEQLNKPDEVVCRAGTHASDACRDGAAMDRRAGGRGS